MTRPEARALWLAAQGFPPPARTTVTAAVAKAGYVRTVGGVDVYLAVRARVPGMTRAALDSAVAKGALCIVPAMRGCIYLVPREDVPACLRAAALLTRRRTELEHGKAGIRKGEVEALARAVLALIRKSGPLTTDAVRKGLPAGAVRSLGGKGKKIGLSSPLPPALRVLEFGGRIERRPEGGRLDTERYFWHAPDKPVDPAKAAPKSEAALWNRMAEVFFGAAGIGAVEDFAAWAGISKRDAQAAAQQIAVEPVRIEGSGREWLISSERKKALLAASGTERVIAFLPFEDNVVALRAGPAFMVDEEFHGLKVPTWGGKGPTTLGQAKHIAFRTLIAGGGAAGFWEFDPSSGKIVTALFRKPSPADRERIASEAADLERFFREETGHARSFSLDTDADLADRAKAIRAMKF